MARGCESYSFLQKGWLAVAKPTPPMDRRRDAQARGYDAESIKDAESCRGDAPNMSGVVINQLSMRILSMIMQFVCIGWRCRACAAQHYTSPRSGTGHNDSAA